VLCCRSQDTAQPVWEIGQPVFFGEGDYLAFLSAMADPKER